MLPGQILGDRYQIQSQLGKQTGRRTFLSQDLKTGDIIEFRRSYHRRC